MDKLYEQYGKLMIEHEILSNKIQQVKQQLALKLNKTEEQK